MVTSLTPVGSPEDIPPVLQVVEEHTAAEQAGLSLQPPSPTRDPPPPVDTSSPPVPSAEQQLLSPQSPSSATEDVPIPPLLINGVPMLKVSAKKQKRYIFRLDPDEGQIIWHSKKLRFSE